MPTLGYIERENGRHRLARCIIQRWPYHRQEKSKTSPEPQRLQELLGGQRCPLRQRGHRHVLATAQRKRRPDDGEPDEQQRS